MLIIQHYKANQNLVVLPFERGVRSILANENPSEESGWTLLKVNWTKSGDLRFRESFSGVVVPLDSGAGKWIYGKRNESIEALNPIQVKSSKATLLDLNRDCKTIEMWFRDGRFRGSFYPSALSSGEELQFPVVGSQHFICLLEGRALWKDRESDRRICLENGDLMQFFRPNQTQEYLNLKLVGEASRSTLLWGVIHDLSNH